MRLPARSLLTICLVLLVCVFCALGQGWHLFTLEPVRALILKNGEPLTTLVNSARVPVLYPLPYVHVWLFAGCTAAAAALLSLRIFRPGQNAGPPRVCIVLFLAAYGMLVIFAGHLLVYCTFDLLPLLHLPLGLPDLSAAPPYQIGLRSALWRLALAWATLCAVGLALPRSLRPWK